MEAEVLEVVEASYDECLPLTCLGTVVEMDESVTYTLGEVLGEGMRRFAERY